MAMNPIGVVVLLFEGTHLWLAERVDLSRPYCGLWAAPGGSVEPGEKLRDAAIREVFEETGLVLTPQRLDYGTRTEHEYDDGRPFTMHWFSARLKRSEYPQNMEPHKQERWMKFPFWQMPESTPGTEEAVRTFLRYFFEESGEWFQKQRTDALVERVRELEAACFANGGSKENSEVFDVLLAAGHIPMRKDDVRMASIVAKLCEEREAYKQELERLKKEGMTE